MTVEIYSGRVDVPALAKRLESSGAFSKLQTGWRRYIRRPAWISFTVLIDGTKALSFTDLHRGDMAIDGSGRPENMYDLVRDAIGPEAPDQDVAEAKGAAVVLSFATESESEAEVTFDGLPMTITATGVSASQIAAALAKSGAGAAFAACKPRSLRLTVIVGERESELVVAMQAQCIVDDALCHRAVAPLRSCIQAAGKKLDLAVPGGANATIQLGSPAPFD